MNSKFINSLGIVKSEKDTNVVVAMSGGVDSSTVAGLMKKEGYNVLGVTLKLYDDAQNLSKIKTMLRWSGYNGCQKSCKSIKY